MFFHSHELALLGLTVPNIFQHAEHNTWLGAELADSSWDSAGMHGKQ